MLTKGTDGVPSSWCQLLATTYDRHPPPSLLNSSSRWLAENGNNFIPPSILREHPILLWNIFLVVPQFLGHRIVQIRHLQWRPDLPNGSCYSSREGGQDSTTQLQHTTLPEGRARGDPLVQDCRWLGKLCRLPRLGGSDVAISCLLCSEGRDNHAARSWPLVNNCPNYEAPTNPLVGNCHTPAK